MTEISVTPLTSVLIDIIKTEGPITLERYMEVVLHHPEYGYYRQGNPLGVHGDFITSPDMSQMFGEMVGVWCVNAWQRLGSPSSFILLELGPGQGSLLQAALQYTQSASNFMQAMQCLLFESNATLRSIQKEKLGAYNVSGVSRPHGGSDKSIGSCPRSIIVDTSDERDDEQWGGGERAAPGLSALE